MKAKKASKTKAHKQKKSRGIARKMTIIMALIGTVTIIMCLLNAAALSAIQTYNDQLAACIHAFESGNISESVSAEADNALNKSAIRITGTLTFNFILIAISILTTLFATFLAMRIIVAPAKDVSHELDEIVAGIEKEEGDLTRRVRVRSNDEVGKIANGVNAFLSVLQEYMTHIRTSADTMRDSTVLMTGQIEHSDQSVAAVSAAAQELAASIEEITATLQQIAENSESVREHTMQVSGTAKKVRTPQRRS